MEGEYEAVPLMSPPGYRITGKCICLETLFHGGPNPARENEPHELIPQFDEPHLLLPPLFIPDIKLEKVIVFLQGGSL